MKLCLLCGEEYGQKKTRTYFKCNIKLNKEEENIQVKVQQIWEGKT